MPSAAETLVTVGGGSAPVHGAARCIAVRGRERKAALQRAASVRVDLIRLRALPPTTPPGGARGPEVAVMFAIGTKVGSAVVRNRIRRRLRAAVREFGPPLDGWSVMLTAGSDAADVPFDALRHAMSAAVQRVLEPRPDRAVPVVNPTPDAEP